MFGCRALTAPRTVLVLLAAAFLVAAGAARAEEVVTVGGAGTAMGTMQLLKNAFEKKHPGIRVKVLPSLGSSGAVKAVSRRALDIGVISRPLQPKERDPKLLKMDFARTPFVFIANPKVPLDDVDPLVLQRIYSGGIAKWSTGERVRLVLRPAADADTKAVKAISPGIDAAVDEMLRRDGMLVALTNQECLDLVEKTPGSLGFTSLAQVISERRRLKLLSYNGVRPSLATLSKGAYPLSQTLSIITMTPVSPALKSFIDFVASPEGERILEQAGSSALRGTSPI